MVIKFVQIGVAHHQLCAVTVQSLNKTVAGTDYTY
jgi:hypothetical protein